MKPLPNPNEQEETAIMQAMEILKEEISIYTMTLIKNEIFEKKHNETQIKLEKIYKTISWWQQGEDQRILRIEKRCESRSEALNYISSHNLKNPEFQKTCYATKKGDPITRCALTCKGEIEGVGYEIEVSYTRGGLPTRKCRIVEQLSYAIACDL